MAQRTVRSLARSVLPRFVGDLVDDARQRRSGWSYVGEAWPADEGPEGPGWNVQSVVDAYARGWPQFLATVSQGVFSASPDGAPPNDLRSQNSTLVFAYSLARAAVGRSSLTMLDWGGAIGHYLAIARAVVPGISIEYTCRDLPLLAAHGQTLFPDATFTSDDDDLDDAYDFVLASSSLQYSRDWTATVDKLAGLTRGSVLVTRIPTVLRVPSFVYRQEVPEYGTAYPGWCLNRSELLRAAEHAGLCLVHEFDLGYEPFMLDAPEQCVIRGFLLEARGSRHA